MTQGRDVPSKRFRFEQYLPDLAAHGVAATMLDARFGAYPPPERWKRPGWLLATGADALLRVMRSRAHDLCFLQRHLVSTLCTWEPMAKAPVVFDVDDAIFLGPRGAQADRIARHATLVLCGNRFLAEHFAPLAPVALLPTAVDTDRFVPRSEGAPEAPVIGWSGSSSGFQYLYDIEEALAIVLQRHPEASLTVVADQPPRFQRLPQGRWRFQRWQADTEVQALQTFSIGLMPLKDNDWARGKCSFKMLTYMSVGIPVVVSPVGMNVDVLAHGDIGLAARHTDEWVAALDLLIHQRSRAALMGATGRQVAEQHYARRVVGRELARRLLQVAA